IEDLRRKRCFQFDERIASAVCHGIKTAEAVRAFVTFICTRLKPGNGRTSASKRKTETEVKRPEIFELARVRIHTVVEANRADRQFVTQTPTNRVAYVAQPNVLGRRQQIAGVSKYGALQFTENWECIFNIEDG